MERGKARAQNQLQTLNKECEITNELLIQLKQKCSNHVNQIVNCDNKNFQPTSKHLVDILKFQSQTIQKLIEWNINLEKSLAEMEPAVTETTDIVDLYDIYFPVKANREKNESAINLDMVKNYTKNETISSDSWSYMTNCESNETAVEIKPCSEIDDGGNNSLNKDIAKEPIEIEVDNDLKVINGTFDSSLSIHKGIVQNDTPNKSIASFDKLSNSDQNKNPAKIYLPLYGKFYSDLEEKYRNVVKLYQKAIPERNAPKIGDICKIGFAQTPSVIYIQVIDTDNVSLDVLSMQLLYEYQVSPIIYTPNKIAAREFGNFWIFQFKNVMYRIEVVDWLLNVKSDTVLVQMIDYGWRFFLNYAYLKVLNTNLRNIPRMAQLCHFGHLYPPGSTIAERKQTWPQEVNHKFYTILGNLDETYYRIVDLYYCKERKSYGINLSKTIEENKDNTIGQLLIDFKIAVEIFDGNSQSISKK